MTLDVFQAGTDFLSVPLNNNIPKIKNVQDGFIQKLVHSPETYQNNINIFLTNIEFKKGFLLVV